MRDFFFLRLPPAAARRAVHHRRGVRVQSGPVQFAGLPDSSAALGTKKVFSTRLNSVTLHPSLHHRLSSITPASPPTVYPFLLSSPSSLPSINWHVAAVFDKGMAAGRRIHHHRHDVIFAQKLEDCSSSVPLNTQTIGLHKMFVCETTFWFWWSLVLQPVYIMRSGFE